VDIDPVTVPVIALRCVVGHSAFCSPFVRSTDPLDSYMFGNTLEYDASRASKADGRVGGVPCLA
jgi:hypothetical protein